jgi:hypothetical protein
LFSLAAMFVIEHRKIYKAKKRMCVGFPLFIFPPFCDAILNNLYHK